MSTQRDELARIVNVEGAWCGECEFEGWDSCAECRSSCRGFADAILAAGWTKPRTDITVEWGTGEGTELMRWRDRGQAERQSASATKSSDGGKTWQHTNPPIVSRIVTEWEPTA